MALSEAAERVLAFLRECDHASTTNMADALYGNERMKGTVNLLCEDLERRGLVRRRPQMALFQRHPTPEVLK